MIDDKKEIVWAICNVPYEIRDKAKKLAKSEKKTIGVLLSELIAQHTIRNLEEVGVEEKNLPSRDLSSFNIEERLVFIEKYYLDSIHLKIDKLTQELANFIYNNNFNKNVEKKSFWSNLL